MASSSAPVAPADGSDKPAVASFASLTTFNASLSENYERFQNACNDPEERRMGNIVYAVREDCVTLLQHFEAKGSLRFQDFAASWRDMMFSHMLSGRPSSNLRVEYLQRVFTIVVRLFAAGQELIRKVGALYIMYGLYMKLGRGERTLVSIRITPSVWMVLKDVRRQAFEQNHHDVHFVIDRLLFQSAFAFVATEVEMSPDLVYRSAWNIVGDNGGEEEAEENPLQEYLDDGGLQQLSTLHKKYEAIKQKVFGGGSSGRINALGPDLIPGIRARLEAFAKGKRPADTPAASEDQSAEPTILSERQSARANAFARFFQESKEESESESELESESLSEEQSSSEEEEMDDDDDDDEQDEAPLSQSPPRRGRGRGSRGVGRGTRGIGHPGSLGAGSGTGGGGRGRSPRSTGRRGGRRGTRNNRGSSRGRGAKRGTQSSSANSWGSREATSSTSGRGRGRSRPRGRGRGRGRTSQ